MHLCYFHRLFSMDSMYIGAQPCLGQIGLIAAQGQLKPSAVHVCVLHACVIDTGWPGLQRVAAALT